VTKEELAAGGERTRAASEAVFATLQRFSTGDDAVDGRMVCASLGIVLGSFAAVSSNAVEFMLGATTVAEGVISGDLLEAEPKA
jgi:hypothetical protein